MNDSATIERESFQIDQMCLRYEVSDEALEAAASGDCAGRLMLSAEYWSCPCDD